MRRHIKEGNDENKTNREKMKRGKRKDFTDY
jgi:hypothetical protein